MLFLLISYIFWLMLTLNIETQEDVEIPIELKDVPDSVTIISEIPTSLKVSIRDKGSVLMRYNIGGLGTMKIDWKQYSPAGNRFLMGKADLGARLRDYFAPSSQIVSVVPDSLRLTYTTAPGRRVAVDLKADVSAAIGYVVGQSVITSTDSVTLYSVTDLPAGLTSISTYPIVRSDLTDTTTISVRIEPMEGVKIVPSQISVTIPVEPLIARRQMAPVVAKNVPHGIGLLTFPSSIEVSYLVPMSEYNSEPYDVKAYVDYVKAVTSTTGKIPVSLSLMPQSYKNVSISPDSVEYIIEHH